MMPSATRCARVVVAELISAGVHEVVLAPGSRSAPLAYELYEADRIGLLRLHVRIDERTAGFLALGVAKASGGPVAVVTTSGTAAANLHPAVLEAWHSAVPLLAVTADRPRVATFTGANQTTDQAGLYGTHVRACVTLDDRGGSDGWWQFEVGRLLAAATGSRTGQPGPVHLNISFSEPLVPEVEPPPSAHELVVAPRLLAPEPVPLDGGPQTVVVAGDLPPAQGRAWAASAARAGIPLLAEPSSNARRGPSAMGTYRVLLRSSLVEDIERVVMVGHPTLSRPVNQLLARDDVELVVVAGTSEWLDPGRNAHLVVDAVDLEPGPSEWLERWRDADRAVRADLDALLEQQPMLTGPALAARLWTTLGAADTLVCGSSSPIRDLDLAPVTAEPPTTYANRGLSGIDGTVSTAVGVAAVVERPVHALLGDETFLHDLTGLLVARSEPRPDLRLVVAHDNGGSIFATLEQGHPSHSRAFERIFGTPHDADLVGAAAALGARALAVTSLAELDTVLAEPPIGLEVVVAVADRAHRRTLTGQISGLAASF
jgi:2-succinyl-5-enolpyruvyl-6-hydroxy-3-cyclohexene-1-carboxylate synthase